MRRKRRDQLTTLTGMFYDLLVTGSFVTAAMILSQGRASPKLTKCFARYAVWRIRQVLREQKLRGYIVYDEEDEQRPIILTERGFARVAALTLRNRRERWDHLWRLIVFDIPERKRARKRFQRVLGTIGCCRIQRSVYAYPFDCEKEIHQLTVRFRIASNVDVYVVPHLGRQERHARNFFLQREYRM